MFEGFGASRESRACQRGLRNPLHGEQAHRRKGVQTLESPMIPTAGIRL